MYFSPWNYGTVPFTVASLSDSTHSITYYFPYTFTIESGVSYSVKEVSSPEIRFSAVAEISPLPGLTISWGRITGIAESHLPKWPMIGVSYEDFAIKNDTGRVVFVMTSIGSMN